MQISSSPLVAAAVARRLLTLEAVKLNPRSPFQWASGWKSPIYCDNRITLSDVDTRQFIKRALAEFIQSNFPEVGGIAGVATAGLPQGALVADKLGLPFIYVRSKAKAHGRQNQIEGNISKGKNWVVLEDLVSTGGSSLAAVDALRETGANVEGLAAIFTYGLPLAVQNFEDAKVKWGALSHYDALIGEAQERGIIQSQMLDTLRAWKENPSEWKG
ncbi:MAG: orotate phosphoribosyltransferase [Bacteroidota bacterium]